MKKIILGLDIGTNSIGWVLFRDKIVFDKGVIIFPIGTNVDKNGIEETKNMERGKYRRASRNHFRYKLRRKDLKKLLATLNMLPTFTNTFKIKKKYQAAEFYQLRANALDKQITAEEIGRIFLLINKHRGFKSNSKTLSENKNDEGVVKEDIRNLSESMKAYNARTLGEYFHKMYEESAQSFNDGKWHNIDEPFDVRAIDNDGVFSLQKNRGIRREGRFVGRDMYANEFDLIWDEQRKYYPQLTGSKKEYDTICKLPVEQKIAKLKLFKDTYYWKIKQETIFFQRPLKSQKKFIGKCQFEKNKRTAPASSLLFQEFRIWKQLADVRYTDKENDIYKQPLPPEWKQKIFDYLETHLSLSLKQKRANSENIDVLDLLGIVNKKNFEFNYDDLEEDKKFHGNKTLYAIYATCGEEKYNQLKAENKLEKLWHILYMAKDDEWLKDTLTWKWDFDPATANRLIEMGLEEGFANYSSKVIENLLPHMKNGNDEHNALVLTKYRQSSDEDKVAVKLKSKITQLTNNELRNPVVEKAVGETIRLVNTILKDHGIDQEDFTIRVESTREFKKPKEERQNIRRKNLDTEKRREEYARFLNEKKNKGELNFSRDIQRSDSIINKFELWLELGADKNNPDFNDFEKIVERRDREKHTLWLDCNRICPYSGNIITLSKLFSPEIEIEHIIPYSWSLDDSFTNKTLTFGYINAEKKNRSAYEYMKSKGEAEFKAFKNRVKAFTNKEKAEERFLSQKPEQTFTNAQARNASYIAVYVRKKLQEVCRDVQFTNGFATGELRKNDWRLGNLLDKVRYQEETGIDVDKYARELANYKRDFELYRKRKANSTDIIRTDWKNLTQEITAEYEGETKNPIYEWWQQLQEFDKFRGAKGKKDRSDHRHHLLDAIIIAMCSPSIIQKLSTLNQQREKQGATLYDEKGELTRERIDLPIPYAEIKATLESVLVYHKAEQRLITAKQNRIHKKKHTVGDSSVIKQRTIAPRGSLHKATYYGKIKVYNKEQNTNKEVFASRYASSISDFNTEKSLEAIYDKDLKEIIRRRLIYFKEKNISITKDAYEKYPLFKYSLKKYPDTEPENPISKKGKPLPVIKKVRTIYNFPRKMLQIHAKENGTIINTNRYAESDGNYIMALYELKVTDKKGNEKKAKRDFTLLKFYEAVKKREKKENFFTDEKLHKDGTYLPRMISCPSLKQGDFVVMYENNEAEIIWNDMNNLKERLFKVTGLSSEEGYGLISFIKHNISSQNATYGKSSFELSSKQKSFSNRHTQFNGVKVKIDRLGIIKQTTK